MRNDIYLKVRVGLPQRGGALVAAARERGLPALVSVNAFVRYDKDRRFRGFALPHARPAQRRHEMSLQELAYNFKRVIQLLGMRKTMQAMRLLSA